MELLWAFLWLSMGLVVAGIVHAVRKLPQLPMDWRYPVVFHFVFWLWPLALCWYGPAIYAKAETAIRRAAT